MKAMNVEGISNLKALLAAVAVAFHNLVEEEHERRASLYMNNFKEPEIKGTVIDTWC